LPRWFQLSVVGVSCWCLLPDRHDWNRWRRFVLAWLVLHRWLVEPDAGAVWRRLFLSGWFDRRDRQRNVLSGLLLPGRIDERHWCWPLLGWLHLSDRQHVPDWTQYASA
jgi:hypothetical protein